MKEVSIDLGSEWLKVAVVNLKPGQPPISIAINEMSKRKTPSLISFHADSRLIGEESLNLLARYPNKVYSHLPSLLGKPYSFARDLLQKLYLSYEMAPDDVRGVPVFQAEGGNFTAEELVGMVLKYAAGLAETHSRASVKDVVITVPPFAGVAERRGLLAAADLAGLNVLALVNEHSGAALQYGIDKDFSNGSRHVVFYDMGASSTYAALVYFSAYNAKELGKSVSVNQFQVKDVKWDAELGGQSMELRLVEYFADEFNKQLGNGDDIRNSPKAMAKLKKQVKRTKEILSANMMAPISVESLYDDRDFRSTISREKFEDLCKDLWEKALVPLKELLEHSGLKADDLYAVELIGGATRVPKLQAKLQEFLGRKELDKHLDADEAIVLGASLHAANLSDGIKLNRKLGMIDGTTYGFVFELNGDGLLKDESTRQLIVPRMKKLPSKMFRSIVHNKDFEVSLSYESQDLLPLGSSSLVFAQYDVSGLSDASERYSSRNLSSPIKANLHFSLSRSGTLSLDRAEAVVEITEWIEVPRKNITVDNSTSASANITDGDTKNPSEENPAKLETTNGNGNSSESSINDNTSTVDLGTEKKLKKKTFRVPLKVIEKTTGPGMPLSKESFAEVKQKLEALDKKDSERRRTAELKNNLEGYIYSTKDKLESDEFGEISTEQERQTMELFTFFIFSLFISYIADGAGFIGVNYGRVANNLPSASKVVQLLKSQGLDRVKVYDTDPAVLRALSGSGIKVTVNLPNELLSSAARRPSFALSWVQKNIAAYHPSTSIEAVAVGNEVFVDPHNTTRFLLPAMYNIQKALSRYNLDTHIKVSSPVALSALRSSYPSSSGSFRAELVSSVFKPMLDYLRRTEAPLMINVYPFFAYESNADVILLDYALFRPNSGSIDGGNGLKYFSLFDAQVDAVFAAMSALGYDDIPITVSETGWPSMGDQHEIGATVENAADYNKNLVNRVLAGGGTPLRPHANLTVFLFALFNENKKPGPTSERNFGLFYPDGRKVYDIPFTTKGYNSKDESSSPVKSGGSEKRVAAGSGQTWCVAKGDVGPEKLQAALDYACGEGGADCHMIQPGSACFDPNTLEAHASYAFNSYYQKKGRAGGTCYFGGAAFVVSQQPKYGKCELSSFGN
ncbi:Heat shock 70 kDa protein 17 [Striga hermonthica]|uniref:glucan endo-1,3-beta-D-glucosidase n=1 Tax=Striga hermonthica TaxID=68872 RepID=A0A9N7NB04_STRHE|nr:Heat shock 70 kDa protein 17 [Striga hermonthica]